MTRRAPDPGGTDTRGPDPIGEDGPSIPADLSSGITDAPKGRRTPRRQRIRTRHPPRPCFRAPHRLVLPQVGSRLVAQLVQGADGRS